MTCDFTACKDCGKTIKKGGVYRLIYLYIYT